MSKPFEQFLEVVEVKSREYPLALSFFIDWKSTLKSREQLLPDIPGSDKDLVVDLMRSSSEYFYVMHGLIPKQPDNQQMAESVRGRTIAEREGFFEVILLAAKEIGVEIPPKEVQKILLKLETPLEALIRALEKKRFDLSLN